MSTPHAEDSAAEEPEADHPEVKAAVDGDPAALETLLEQCGPWLRGKLAVSSRHSRAMEVDDVIQVTFMEAFMRIQQLQSRSLPAFRAWLLRIGENNLKDAIRALDRDKRPDVDRRVTTGPQGESSRTLLGRIAPTAPSQATRMGEEEQVALLLAALDRLPTSYARVVRALDLEERPLADVAEELSRSKGALHMLRARAHDRLREILAGAIDSSQ
ncbi:MAG: RNA polymerase sigma factor [Planctomycetota bacterium]